MKPGSPEWFQERDFHRVAWFKADEGALRFVAALGAYVELWDDLIDKDKPIEDERVHETMAAALLEIACNPFVARHQAYLRPLLVQMVSGYWDSENLCRHENRAVREVAFHTRNYMLELYHACAFLTGGMEHLRSVSPAMREFFAFEAFDEWEYANG